MKSARKWKISAIIFFGLSVLELFFALANKEKADTQRERAEKQLVANHYCRQEADKLKKQIVEEKLVVDQLKEQLTECRNNHLKN